MSPLLHRKTAASTHPAQIDAGDTCGDVQTGLALERKRLQFDGAIGAADQHIGADARPHGGLGAGAAIASRKGARSTGGRGIDEPHHPAASGDADIDAELGQRAGIKLYRPGNGWREGTIQRTLRAKDQADTAGNVACKLADLSPLLCGRRAGDYRGQSGNHRKFSAFSHESPLLADTLPPPTPRAGEVRVGVAAGRIMLSESCLAKSPAPDFLYDIT